MLESREGPETCNTYNMLRLTELLFRGKPLAEYADYYERSLYNHILSTQHPEHGGYVYFTPIRPRHYRVYSQPKECFWCCVGTGMENHGKHGQFVYAHRGDELFVNLFVASELKWPERGLTVRQDTTFPDEPRTRLRLTLAQPRQFVVHVRHPAWVAEGAFRVTINGQAWPARSTPSSYVAIDRSWRDGDRIEIELPMRTRLERLPDGSDYAAIMHGPILLAAKTGTERLDGLIAGPGRMEHRSEGPYEPLGDAPMLVGDDVASLAARVEPVPGRPLTFRAPGAIRPADGARPRAGAVLPRPRQPLHDLLARRDSVGLRARRLRAARDRALAAAAGGADARPRRPRRAAERDRPRRPQRVVDDRRHARAALPRRRRLVRLRAEARERARTAAAARHLSRQRTRPPVRDPRGRSAGGDRRRSTDASRIGSPTSPIRFPPRSSPPTRTACWRSASSPRPARAPARSTTCGW